MLNLSASTHALMNYPAASAGIKIVPIDYRQLTIIVQLIICLALILNIVRDNTFVSAKSSTP